MSFLSFFLPFFLSLFLYVISVFIYFLSLFMYFVLSFFYSCCFCLYLLFVLLYLFLSFFRYFFLFFHFFLSLFLSFFLSCFVFVRCPVFPSSFLVLVKNCIFFHAVLRLLTQCSTPMLCSQTANTAVPMCSWKAEEEVSKAAR